MKVCIREMFEHEEDATWDYRNAVYEVCPRGKDDCVDCGQIVRTEIQLRMHNRRIAYLIAGGLHG